MVLADAENIEADLVGVHDFVDQVAQPLRRTEGAAAVGVRRSEAVDADLHQSMIRDEIILDRLMAELYRMKPPFYLAPAKYTVHQTPRFSSVAASICLILTIAGCGDGPTDPAKRTSGIRAVLGAGVSDTIDTQPVQALVVEVRGDGGALVPAGTLVRFEVQPADPSPARVYYMPSIYVCELTAPTCGGFGFGAPGQVMIQTTDDHGRVKAVVRLGGAAGRAVVRLVVPELGLVDSATYTVLAGAPSHVRAALTDTSLDIGGTVALHGLVLDRNDNVRKEQVTITAGPGSAITLDAATSTVTGRDMGTQWVFTRYTSFVDSTRIGVVPSGRLVVWDNGAGAVRLVNLNGSNERTIASGVASDLGAFPSFDPTRQRVTFHDGSQGYGGTPNTVIIADTTGSSERIIGEATGFSVVVGTRQLADGTVLVAGVSSTDTSHPGYSLWRVANDNTITFVVGLPGLGRTYGGADISHSGTRVAYIATDPTFGGTELRVLNVSDGSTVSLERGALSPRWSAHDDLVAYLLPSPGNGFDANYNGPAVIINPDGTGRRTLGTGSFSTGLGWSPDGTYIVGRASEGLSLRLLRVGDAATVVLRFLYIGGIAHDYWQPDWR
jgi:hypothetical protein